MSSPRLFASLFLTLATFGGIAAIASAASSAPDFPPGQFSDGGHYKLSDFQGKVVVLFFYEQECPTCRGLIPKRNEVVEQFKGKPVKFIAVGAGDSLTDAIGYVKDTKLEMPSFADSMGLMEHRYGFHISLQNIYQFRIIGPNGNIAGMSMEPAAIEQALKGVKWKYKDDGYDPKLDRIINALEWNQYEPAVRALKVATKSSPKSLAESATKLMDAVKAEAKGWLDEAEKVKGEDPVKAYDLYTRVSACFPAPDDLGKQADAALKTLRKDKAVTDELTARAMYDAVSAALGRGLLRKPADVAASCDTIAKRFPAAPTGKKAAELATEIHGVASGDATGSGAKPASGKGSGSTAGKKSS